MKRRSARPFVVEIKNQARPARIAHGDVPGGDRSGGDLWRGLLTEADEAPQERPRAAPTRASVVGPVTAAPVARRILPNLIPACAPDPIPEPDEIVAGPVRRRRGPGRRKTAPPPAAMVAPEPMPAADLIPAPDRRPVAVAPIPPPAPPVIRSKPTHRRPDVLRPGERWKRRLTRHAR